MKTEKTQIHFLSDVLVVVASLDLKVPIITLEYTKHCAPLNKEKNTQLHFQRICL